MSEYLQHNWQLQTTFSELHCSAKWEAVNDLMDCLRAKLGAQALSLGITGEVPGGYLGGKIAFGHIPDEEDFSELPGADGNTHFVTMRNGRMLVMP